MLLVKKCKATYITYTKDYAILKVAFQLEKKKHKKRKAGHILNLFNIFPALPRRTALSTLNLFTPFLFTTLLTILPVRRGLFTYTIHCLMFLPSDCGGSVFGSCFVMPYVSVISSLQSS